MYAIRSYYGGLELKQRANNYIAEGPEEYNKADSDRMRYFITDALDDLRDDSYNFV